MNKRSMEDLSKQLIMQLRLARLDQSILMSVCGIQSEQQFDEVIRYIESHSEFRIRKDAKGAYILRPAGKQSAPKKEKQKDEIPGVFRKAIESKSRVLKDASTGNSIKVEIR